jgi:hypothetical protein
MTPALADTAVNMSFQMTRDPRHDVADVVAAHNETASGESEQGPCTRSARQSTATKANSPGAAEHSQPAASTATRPSTSSLIFSAVRCCTRSRPTTAAGSSTSGQIKPEHACAARVDPAWLLRLLRRGRLGRGEPDGSGQAAPAEAARGPRRRQRLEYGRRAPHGPLEAWDEFLCVTVLCYIGGRRNSASMARRRDVDLERGTIRLHEKGGKKITKPIPDELAAIIHAADEDALWASGDDYLIPNRRKPSRRALQQGHLCAAQAGRRARRGKRAPACASRRFRGPVRRAAPRRNLGAEGTARPRTNRNHARLTPPKGPREGDGGRTLVPLGASVFPPNPGMPPAGFEPALQP